MSDDWKGEDKIRRVPTKEERIFGTRSLASSISHKRRTAAGTNMSRTNGYWSDSIRIWHRIYNSEEV